MQAYKDVVRRVLDEGTRKENRTGVDTWSTFHVSYSVDLRAGFPLLTTKQISWKNIVAENLWFLSGDTHIGLLRRHGCKFWDPWADAHGRVPSAYGSFWRRFPTLNAAGEPSFNDQVRWVLGELAANPLSRRLVINAWSPGNAQESKLPPCHLLFIFNVQIDRQGERWLNLHLTQRSCDVALGLPYNLAGYAFLLEVFARLSGLRAGRFGHTLVDAHVYTAKPDGAMAEYDHVPGLEQQLAREVRPLPRLHIDPAVRRLEDVEALFSADTDQLLRAFRLEGYDPHPAINFKVAV